MLVFPPTPNIGDSFEGWSWDGAKWTCAGGAAGGGANVFVGQPAPATAQTGDLWWDVRDGALSVFTGSAWVSTTCGGGGAGAPKAGDVRFDSGELQQFDGTTWQMISIGGGGPPFMGVTDGSDAQPGEIGEYLFTVRDDMNLTSGVASTITLNVTPGDWELSGMVTIRQGGSGAVVSYVSGYFLNILPNPPWGGGIYMVYANRDVVNPSHDFSFSGVRLNIAVARAVVLNIVVNFTGGSGQMTSIGILGARRVR